LGAEKWITIKEKAKNETIENFLKKIKKKGYELIGTSPHMERKTVSITKFKAPKKFIVAFGNEEEGLSNELIKHCDKLINIPMYGFSESYNISVTCAITLSLISIKLREKKKISTLSNKEKRVLKLEWYKKSIKNSNLIIKRLEKE
jgi:tRNA (guanosine-2'-O-)-methyltransferase